MTDITNNVVTNFVVNNKGATALSALSASAGRVSSLFDRASGIVGTFGSVAAIAGGAMSLTHIVKGTQDYLDQLKKVQDYTKMSADSAGGLMDAMESVGISGNEGVRALMQMSKAGARANMASHGMRRGMQGMGKEFQRLGIDLAHGPEKAIMKMAEHAKKGTVDQAKVGLLFRMQGETARKFTNLLKKGPEHIREQVAEYKKLGIATQENIDRQDRIRELGLKIRGTWENIQRIIGIQLLPVVEDLMRGLSEKLTEWLPKAKKFGETLANFLRDHLSTVKQITKVLLLNFSLMKMTGQGMIGWGQKLGGGFLKSAGVEVGKGAAGVASVAAERASQAAANTPIITAMNVNTTRIVLAIKGKAIYGDGLGDFASKTVARVPSGVAKIPVPKVPGVAGVFGRFTSALPGMARFAATALRLVGGAAVLAVVIGTILKAVQLIRANVDGIGSHVSGVFDKIVSRFMVIADMFDTTFGEGSALGDFFHKFVFGVVMIFSDVLDEQIHLLQTIMETISFIAKNPAELLNEGIGSMLARAYKYTEQQTNEKQRQREIARTNALIAKQKADRDAARRDRPKEPYNDFRGSRFDITQKFSEGFDPDRIALAFSSDLAALGERKLQAGSTPLYALR